MKQCPRCRQSYSDDNLNFCLDDGELLMALDAPATPRFTEDPPPTLMLDQSRVTNPSNWPSSPPAAQWQQQNLQQQPYVSPAALRPKRDQTLPTIALVLGILSVALICCYGGIWLGLPAAVVGFLGMRNADSNPGRYSGRGLAIGGMVLGVISFLGSILFAIIMIFAN